MSLPSNYKPSPLSFNSPRTSPFQRPSSPLSPTTTIRATTPTKPLTPLPSPSKLQTVSTAPSPASNSTTPTPAPAMTPSATTTHQQQEPRREMRPTNALNTDALARLPPAQVREMREAFQVLDRDGDGLVTREDVAEILSSLGQPPTPQTLAPFFPASNSNPAFPFAPTITLPLFLSHLSTLLVPLSPPAELLAAFAAFDDHDGGEVDLSELRHALMSTHAGAEGSRLGAEGSRLASDGSRLASGGSWMASGGSRMGLDKGDSGMTEKEVDQVLDAFRGRRTFDRRGAGAGLGRGNGKGDVFRYREFVGRVGGGGDGNEGGEGEGAM